jgi:hypothetical protein
MLTWIFWEVHKFSVISSENKTCHQTLFPQKVCDGTINCQKNTTQAINH